MHPTSSSSASLTGLRVVELGRGIAAAYCTKLLADLGADVTIVEPASGHPLRAHGPIPSEDADRGGALFQYLAGGKRSVALDLTIDAARRDLAALAARADVLVEDLGPDELERITVSDGVATRAGGPLAVVSISPFGRSGPYAQLPATSLVVQAAGGWAARIGTPEGPPFRVGGLMEEYVGGAFAAAAALTALRHAQRTGERADVDVSLMECMAGTTPYPMLQKITFDRLGFPVPQRYQPIPGILACADGHVAISALTGQHWADVCALIGVPELAEKMREVTLRGAEWEAFLARARPWLAVRASAEIVELFQAVRVPAVPIGNGANLPDLEPFRSRNFYVEQPGARFLRPCSPFRLSRTPAEPPRIAPRLGEHSSAVLEALRAPAADAPRQSAAAAAERQEPSPPGCFAATSTWGGGRPRLPFSGLKVLDLTSFWAGPYLTMYLASLGADVIKVESPRRPDGFRFVAAFPQLGERWWEQSPLFSATNLGKRAVALDLDRPEGVALAKRLIAEADIVAENYSPRVLEHFGLSSEAILELNPRAIVVRMPGFGLDGPCRDWVGWALTFEQMGGCATVTGERGGRMFAPGGFADPVVGMHAAVAVQAALVHREATARDPRRQGRRDGHGAHEVANPGAGVGEGQLVEIAQIEVVAAMTAEQVIHRSTTGETPERNGNRSDRFAPQGVYRCAGEDEWIALSVRGGDEWRRLCTAIGVPDWAHDPRFAAAAGRRRAHDEIDDAVAAWAAARSAHDAAESLRAAGVPAAALLKTAAIYGEPHLEARGYFCELDHAVCGRLRYPRWPMRFSFGPTTAYAGGAPTLGEHNDEVLAGVLGVPAQEIERLRAAGVIGERMNA